MLVFYPPAFVTCWDLARKPS